MMLIAMLLGSLSISMWIRIHGQQFDWTEAQIFWHTVGANFVLGLFFGILSRMLG